MPARLLNGEPPPVQPLVEVLFELASAPNLTLAIDLNFDLHDYQDQAVADILDSIDEGTSRFDDNRATAVSLTSVTGAGETVGLEALLHGSARGK